MSPSRVAPRVKEIDVNQSLVPDIQVSGGRFSFCASENQFKEV